MHILLIEDDKEASKYFIKGLQESGHVVDHAADGEEGHEIALVGKFDVLIVDRMLPALDGLTLVKKLRQNHNTTPVLFLSALGDVDDKVMGLKSGGDDYLSKPFAFSELLARIEVLVKRGSGQLAETTLKFEDLEMNLLTRRVMRHHKAIDLQPREFKLLEYLLRNAGRVVTRTMLLENVWEYHFDPQTNVIDVHISRLRSKIDKDFTPPLVHTIRGAGYSLRVPD